MTSSCGQDSNSMSVLNDNNIGAFSDKGCHKTSDHEEIKKRSHSKNNFSRSDDEISVSHSSSNWSEGGEGSCLINQENDRGATIKHDDTDDEQEDIYGLASTLPPPKPWPMWGTRVYQLNGWENFPQNYSDPSGQFSSTVLGGCTHLTGK